MSFYLQVCQLNKFAKYCDDRHTSLGIFGGIKMNETRRSGRPAPTCAATRSQKVRFPAAFSVNPFVVNLLARWWGGGGAVAAGDSGG